MPSAPGFSDITRPPMSPPTPTPFSNMQPMGVGPPDGGTGGVIVGPAPTSQPSPAVRPLGVGRP
jgi:hypothetical protein